MVSEQLWEGIREVMVRSVQGSCSGFTGQGSCESRVKEVTGGVKDRFRAVVGGGQGS